MQRLATLCLAITIFFAISSAPTDADDSMSFMPFNYKTIESTVKKKLQNKIKLPDRVQKAVILLQFVVNWDGHISNVHSLSKDDGQLESHLEMSNADFGSLKKRVCAAVASARIPHEKIQIEFAGLLKPGYKENYRAVCKFGPSYSVVISNILPQIKIK